MRKCKMRLINKEKGKRIERHTEKEREKGR